MKLLLIACLFLASCYAGPSGPRDIVIKDSFFREENVIYIGKQEIVRIFVPFNQFHFEDIADQSSSSSSEEIEHPYTLFFVESDAKNENQALYAFQNGKATKVLDNGRDATATHTNVIYFGAKDGIYKYNESSKTATKHGTVTDSIIQLAHNNKTNAIYYLTENHEVYKLNEDATASVKVPTLKDVQEIVFGFEGNMYYYDSDKKFYIIDIELEGTPRVIEGLPAQMNKVALVAPFYGLEDGPVFLVDGRVYTMEAGKADKSPIQINAAITAQAPQPSLVQFYAKDKKLYEINLIAIMVSRMLEELQQAFNDYRDKISSIRKSSF